MTKGEHANIERIDIYPQTKLKYKVAKSQIEFTVVHAATHVIPTGFGNMVIGQSKAVGCDHDSRAATTGLAGSEYRNRRAAGGLDHVNPRLFGTDDFRGNDG